MDNNKDRIKTEYFMGSSRPTEWSSIYYYSPQIPATYEAKGELYSVISLSSPPSFDSEKAGNLLIDQLHETYFESEEKGILLSLEKAVLGVKKRLLELLASDELSSEHGIEFSMVAMSTHEEHAFIVKMGEATIWARRDNESSQLSSVLKDPDGKNEIHVGSLLLNQNDKFLLLTPEAEHELSFKDKDKLLTNFSTDLIKGRRLSNDALTSTLLVGVDLKEEFETETIVEETQQVGNIITKINDEPEIKPGVIKEDDDEQPQEKIIEKEERIIEDNYYQERVLESEGEPKKFNKEEVIANISDKVKAFNVKDSFSNLSAYLKDFKYKKNAKTFQVILAKGLDGIATGLGKFAKYIWSDLLQLDKQNKRGVYVRGGKKETNWRPIIFIGLIVVLVSYFTVTTIKKRNEEKKRLLEVEQTLSTIEDQKDSLSSEARTLVNTFDRTPQKNNVYNSIQDLRSQLTSIDILEDKKVGIENELNEIEQKITRTIKVKSESVIKDLGGLIENITPSDIDIDENSIYISDLTSGIIFSFDHEGGSMKRLAEGLEQPESITISKHGDLVFTDNHPERVIGKINIETQTIERFLGVNADRLGDTSQIDAYRVSDGDDRVYGVRTNTKELIQMKKSGDSYTLPEVRLKMDSFNKLLDVEVNDGRIYIIDENSGVRRFYGDTEFEKDVRGMINNETWDNATSLFVDSKYIYVGDNTNKKVLVFTKTRGTEGEIMDFVAQYDLSEVANSINITDIAGTERGESVFVLAGTKIIELDLDETQNFDY